MRGFTIFYAFIVTCALSALIVRAIPIPADQESQTVSLAIPLLIVTAPGNPAPDVDALKEQFEKHQNVMHYPKINDDVLSNFDSWLHLVKLNQDLLKKNPMMRDYCRSFVDHVMTHFRKVIPERRKEGFDLSSLEEALSKGQEVKELLKRLSST